MEAHWSVLLDVLELFEGAKPRFDALGGTVKFSLFHVFLSGALEANNPQEPGPSTHIQGRIAGTSCRHSTCMVAQ